MAFHHRKLLYQHQDHGSPTPSPHHSPLARPLPHPLASLPDKPSHEVNHHIQVLQAALIVMACMVGVVMFLCTMLMILRSCYLRRHNHNNNNSNNTPILFDVNGDSPVSGGDDGEVGPIIDHPIWFIRTVGLQQSVIDSITVFKYRKDEGLIDGADCSVCLGEFQQDESLRLLPKCSHAFHIPCIDTWLRSHKNCPLCRAPVVNDAASDGNVTEVRVTDEPDSNVSGETQNHEAHTENFDGGEGSYHVGESESFGDDDSGVSSSGISDKILPNLLAEEVEEQSLRRSISMDSSSASTKFRDVINLDAARESSDTNFGDKINSSSKDIVTIAKHGSRSSTNCRLVSIGRVLQKRPISMGRSFSHNRKFSLSRHSRSQSSTLPL